MKILNKKILDSFVSKHSDVRIALERFTNIIEEADWKSHSDLKRDFPSADYVCNKRYVFNIKGNKYRIVVLIIFISDLLIVKYIGKHSDYDLIDCSKI